MRFIFFFFSCALLQYIDVEAANVKVNWDANTPSRDGYKVFFRQAGQAYDYSQPDWTGASNSCTIDNLQSESVYFFVVRAYAGNLESVDSDEISYKTAVAFRSETNSFQATGIETIPSQESGTATTSGIASVVSDENAIYYSSETKTATVLESPDDGFPAVEVPAVSPPLLLFLGVMLLALGWGRQHMRYHSTYTSSQGP